LIKLKRMKAIKPGTAAGKFPNIMWPHALATPRARLNAMMKEAAEPPNLRTKL
jgi:hypothetical protein